MITNKKELRDYLRADFENNYLRTKFRFLDKTKKYLTLLRKAEYHVNVNHRFLGWLYKSRLLLLSNRLLTFIPLNTFGKGLSIAHFGCIYINSSVRAGENCRIHETVTIGATNGSKNAPRLGNNVFIGSGAKVIGDISIADDVAIGAGAVVVRSIDEAGTTWGGVPAKKVSDNNSHSNIKVLMNE